MVRLSLYYNVIFLTEISFFSLVMINFWKVLFWVADIVLDFYGALCS